MLLALTGLLTGAGPAAADEYVDRAVDVWGRNSAGSQVYLDESAGAITPDQADALNDRLAGWRSDIYIAVLPADALAAQPGSSDPDRAAAYLESVHTALGRSGVYLVVFGGVGTYGAAFDTDDDDPASDIGPILAEQIGDHTVGQQDQILNGTLDELGAPGGAGGWWWLLVVPVVVAAAFGGLVWWRYLGRYQRGAEATYRPSFEVYDDEQDTLDERTALAREDVTRLGEELDRDDVPTTDPVVAEHVQAALDAYAEASRWVEQVATDDELRQLRDTTEYARWQHACAQAALAGNAMPPRRVPCFIDPAHGVSVSDIVWAPPGPGQSPGVERPVPVCAACRERIAGEG